jgi:glycine/D-amino acid oxidase-like deaminating enzyme
MKLKSGFPYPLVRNGLLFDYPKLEKNTRTDVLILGGGISGALMAHSLADAGIDCMVIDARSIGLGSTCASTSLLQYEIDTPLHVLTSKMGTGAALRVYRLCADAIPALGSLAGKVGLADFRFKKSFQLARFKKDVPSLEKEFLIRKKYGFDLAFVPGHQLKSEYGIQAHAALLTALAADTDSYLFTHLLLQHLISRGLRVYDRTRAVRFTGGKKRAGVFTQDNLAISSRYLVFASGYEAVDHIPPGLVRLKSSFVTISESLGRPFPFWKDDAVIWTTGDPYLYIRSTADRRIMVGGRDEVVSNSRRDQMIPAKSGQLQRDFRRLIPGLPFQSEFSWTGLFGSTKDGLPFIGKFPGKDHWYFALGFGGNGITFGQVAAGIIRDLIMGISNKDASLFAFTRA